MDPGLVIAIVAAGAAALIGRAAFTALGSASDLMASLFVPPDHRLGWPHGVQERDEPWQWLPSAQGTGPDGSAAGPPDEPLDGPVIIEIEPIQRPQLVRLQRASG